jgi:hypothetical protein
MSIEKAENELNRVFGTTLGLLGRLLTFHSVADKGLIYGVESQIEEGEATLKEMSDSGKLAQLLEDPTKTTEFEALLQSRMKELRNRTWDAAEASIEASCIVFAHSILDACAYGYLFVTSLVAPNLWDPWVEKKKIELSEVRDQSYEQLRNEKVQNFVERVERESLIYKLDLLHKIVPPKKKISNSYEYDRERVVKLDDTRHKIVHRNDWAFHPIDFNSEYCYWNFLNFYFLTLVIHNLGLKLSSDETGKYWKQQVSGETENET